MNIIEEKGISFSLNDQNFTATIVKSQNASGAIFIPRSIFHQNQEYIITTISSQSFSDCDKIELVFSQKTQN